MKDSARYVKIVEWSDEDQWRGVDGLYFRVGADDGKTYILRYTESTDEWSLGKNA